MKDYIFFSVVQTSILSSDPGRPLGPDDFFLARQLPRALTNETAERMMLPLTVRKADTPSKTLEELEAEGAATETAKDNSPKNGLSKLT